MKIATLLARLAILAASTPAWAVNATQQPSTPAQEGHDIWLLLLAGVAALIFISNRQGGTGRRDDWQDSRHGARPQPRANRQPPTPAPASADTLY